MNESSIHKYLYFCFGLNLVAMFSGRLKTEEEEFTTWQKQHTVVIERNDWKVVLNNNENIGIEHY